MAEEKYPHTIGFWKNGSRYISSVLFKSSIPTWCRLEVIKNRYKKTGDSLPAYIGYFVPAKMSDNPGAKKPLAALRKQESDYLDTAAEVFVWIKENKEFLLDYIKNGDEDLLLEKLEEDFE